MVSSAKFPFRGPCYNILALSFTILGPGRAGGVYAIYRGRPARLGAILETNNFRRDTLDAEISS